MVPMLGYMPQGEAEVGATLVGLIAIASGIRVIVRPQTMRPFRVPTGRGSKTPVFRTRPGLKNPLGADWSADQGPRSRDLNLKPRAWRLIGVFTCLFGCWFIATAFLTTACPSDVLGCNTGRWGTHSNKVAFILSLACLLGIVLFTGLIPAWRKRRRKAQA